MIARNLIIIVLLLLSSLSFSQKVSGELFAADTLFRNASVSLSVRDAVTGDIITEYDDEKSLSPASVMKLITTAAALELLGTGYKFKTTIFYSGKLNRRSGILRGNIIIRGGGDPVLLSERFREHYSDFPDKAVQAIISSGIRKIRGKIITDDSRYDYIPVPAKWLREDIGNYYGAGVYGLSFRDNTLDIHLQTSGEGSVPFIKFIEPAECRVNLNNMLTTGRSGEEGSVFSAPYGSIAILTGSLPAHRDDIVLKASIPDPPLVMSALTVRKLKEAGIEVSGEPSTSRIEGDHTKDKPTELFEISSPPLSDIIRVMNHESVNMYAEHLLKEMGRIVSDSGNMQAGIRALDNFLNGSGTGTKGLYLADGSGLSPSCAVNSGTVTNILCYMRSKPEIYHDFYESLPEAGKSGTIKNYFKGPVFESGMRAKSGSMTGVRSYAGYLISASGRELAFCVIINNCFSGTADVIMRIENFLREIILYN
jgi:D-alanyl-D-alanine carboxypeptidase/D-alanyl-D-alanine-endopeptidase (penicillin-binding protein 4)